MRPSPLLFASLFAVAISVATAPAGAADIEHGKYLFAAAGCAGWHTKPDDKKARLAGGRALKTAFGTFYTPNITPDAETGIGKWSDADFVRALRKGVRPDGSNLFPAFPYPSYTKITDKDLLDLKAYIFSLPPVHRQNRPQQLKPPFGWRFLVWGWKLLYFKEGPMRPDPHHDAAWNRGRYLVDALGHCTECHTPRDGLGGPLPNMYLAGTSDGPEGGAIPNITPDHKTGIGGWSESDYDSLFTMGMLPDGDFVGGGMAEVVENTTSHWTAADRKAVIVYLRSIPPVHHKPVRRQTVSEDSSDALPRTLAAE